MKQRHLIIALLLLLHLSVPQAKAQTDDIKQLTKQMYDMFSTRKTQEADFMALTERLKAQALKAGDERLFYRTWANQATFYANRMKRNKGLQTAKEMQEYAAQHNHSYGIYSGAHVIGAVCALMANYDEARKHLRQAIGYLHDHFPGEGAAASYLELARIEYATGHPMEAVRLTDQAMHEPGIEPRHQLNALSIKCLAIADTSNYKIGAKEYKQRFNEVYAQRERIKQQLGRDGIYGPRVECWRLINEQRYDDALKEAEKITSDLTRLEMQQIIYKRKGDFAKAYGTSRKYMFIRDSIYSARNEHLLMEMTAAMDMGRVELEAKNLKLRNQQIQMENIAHELEQKRLTEEALQLTLKNQRIELANAQVKLQNDSLERNNKDLQLSEYQSKIEAQQQSERTQRVMLLASIAIGLLTIGYLCFYLYRRQRAARRLQQAHSQLKEAYDQLEEHTTARERMESELRIARDIQMGMVPHLFPNDPRFDLYADMTPAKQVGGDLYDFYQQGQTLYFCIGDVAGKGVPASMFMSVAVKFFRAYAMEGFPPEYVATKLNEMLSADNDSGMFVTMFIAQAHLDTGRLDYCNAGHNPPLLDGRFLDMEANAPVGLWPEMEFVGQHLDNVFGKTLFLYTDGVNEAENPQQQQYGDDRLQQLLAAGKTASARDTVHTVRHDVASFVDGAEPSDDMTMLCIKFL